MGGLAKWAFGAQIQIGDGATPTEGFTTIAEVLDISGPNLTRDTEDVTPHDAVDGYEEFIATLRRTGEVTFDVNFVPSHATHGPGAGGLIGLYESDEATNFRLVLAASIGYTWAFAAFVTGINPGNPVTGASRASITLKPTGKPVLAPTP
ncbi:MAG TPA: phage tail tube protein [Candidatus Limnocylindrales bacterium]|nr:phage tail tube protein [Candidatus Limnocylindrales bacterium]